MPNLLSWLTKVSVIKESSWHWKITRTTFGKHAYGKVVTYYFIKVPLSLVGHALALAILVGLIAIRAIVALVFWFVGYTIDDLDSITDIDIDIGMLYLYTDYKHRRNGTKMRFAPWEFTVLLLSPLVACWIVVFEPGSILWVIAFIVMYLLVHGFVSKLSKVIQLPTYKALKSWLSRFSGPDIKVE